SAAPRGGAPVAFPGAPGGSPPASPSSPTSRPPTSPVPAAPPTTASPAAVAANAGPATSPNPAAGAPWPVQTAGEPAMYSAAWHHVHLYSPRSINVDSNMLSYRFLYEKRRVHEQRSADALKLTGADAPPEGLEIVTTIDTHCLVSYM